MKTSVLIAVLLVFLGGALAESVYVFEDVGHTTQENLFTNGDTVYVSIITDTASLPAPRLYNVTSTDDTTGTTMNLTAFGLVEWRGNFVIGTTTQENVSIKADGSVSTITIFADLDNNGANATKTITVDNTAPAINSIALNASTVANGQTIGITSNVTDAIAGVDNVTIKVNGTILATSNSTDLYQAQFTAGATEGTYIVNVTANDTVGNTGSSTTSFIVDNSAPTATVVQPLNETYITDSTPLVCLNITDPSGVNQSSIKMNVWDGNSNFPPIGNNNNPDTTTVIPNGYQACIDLTNYVVENDNTHLDVTVNASDSLTENNKMTGFYWWFVIDLNKPFSINVSSPTNASFHTTNPLLNITVEDTASPQTNCTYYLNGTGTNIGLIANNTLNSTALATIDGQYSLQVSCTDLAGNTNTTSSIEFTVDSQPPTINNILLNDSYVNSAQTVLINTTITDFSGVSNASIYVNNTMLTTTKNGDDYSAVFVPGALPDGTYTVNITANDTNANWGFDATTNITIDNQKPVITINEPQGTPNDAHTLQLNATSNELITWTLNITNLDSLQTNQVTASLGTQETGTMINYFNGMTFVNGNYSLVITGVDQASNTNSTTANFTLNDSIAPTQITGLNASDAGTGGQINLVWNAVNENDFDHYKVYWSTTNFTNITGLTSTLNASTTSASVTGLTNGQQYFFGVTSVDENGNEQQNTVTATATPTAPPAGNPPNNNNNNPGGSNPGGSPPQPNNADPPAPPEEDSIDLPVIEEGGSDDPPDEPEVTDEEEGEEKATPTPIPITSPLTGFLFKDGSALLGLAALLAVISMWIIWSSSKTKAKRKLHEN